MLYSYAAICKRVLIVRVRNYLDHAYENQFQFNFKFISEYLERWLTKQIVSTPFKKRSTQIWLQTPLKPRVLHLLLSLYMVKMIICITNLIFRSCVLLKQMLFLLNFTLAYRLWESILGTMTYMASSFLTFTCSADEIKKLCNTKCVSMC